MRIENFAPDTDVVRLTTADGIIVSVERGADGAVYVWVIEEHGVSKIRLGRPGYETMVRRGEIG